mgnify:CR=1 FL=1
MTLVERDAALLHDACDDAGLRGTGADGADAALTVRDAIDLLRHLPGGKKRILAAIHRRAAGMCRLTVKRDRVTSACKQLLDTLPVQDIDIQEVPIEDIIRQIFAR